jgi:hypothetical protein
MVKRARILMFLFTALECNLFSQTLSHQVLVPVAGVSSVGSINYSQTIGETAVEIFSCSDYVFTQGFQQPCIKFSKENPPPGNGVKVYPNPVTDILNIELFGEKARIFRIELVNISGTIVKSEKMVFNGQFWDIQQISVDNISNGLYFVRIVSDDGIINRTFKIDKM